MELGNLEAAAQYLDETEQTNSKVRDEDYQARIEGYRGLLAHLQDNFDEAESHYKEADWLFTRSGHNGRAESIFHRNWADLYIKWDRIPKARDHARKSLALAHAAHQPDLVAYARLSIGNLHAKENRPRQAASEYGMALSEARRPVDSWTGDSSGRIAGIGMRIHPDRQTSSGSAAVLGVLQGL